MKRKKLFVLPLLLVCCLFLFAASEATSSVPPQEIRTAQGRMLLPKIGSQKSEYDSIYGIKTAGGGADNVPPLPNSFVRLEPQPLR